MGIRMAFRMFCLLLAGLVLLGVVAPRYASAAEIGGSGRFSHGAYSSEVGYKVFNYRALYLAESSRMYDQYAGEYYKVISDQDVIAYKLPEDGIHPPQIGNGTVVLMETALYGQDGTRYGSSDGSTFSVGTIYDYIWPSDTEFLLQKCKRGPGPIAPDTNLRVRVTLWFVLPADKWIPSGPWTDQYYSDWF